MQSSPDGVTWQVIVSVLASLSVALTGILYKFFADRLSRMESKINGIIRHLITHSENADRKALSDLIGNGD
jgi:hypothetical protein